MGSMVRATGIMLFLAGPLVPIIASSGPTDPTPASAFIVCAVLMTGGLVLAIRGKVGLGR